MARKQSILAADPVVMPNGQKLSLPDFLSWAKSLDHDTPPQHGSAVACVVAGILSECFPCTGGPIDGASPGPVCGWTFSEVFGPKGGNVTFTPGQMEMNATANNEVPAALKSVAIPTLNAITFQTTFTEFPGATGSGFSQYEFYLMTGGVSRVLALVMVDTGILTLTVGPSAGADTYSAPWTPNNGTHTIHITVSAGGVPTLYIDGILVPLTFLGNGALFTGLPANTVSAFFSSGPTFPQTAVISEIFITSGVLPPTTTFCC